MKKLLVLGLFVAMTATANAQNSVSTASSFSPMPQAKAPIQSLSPLFPNQAPTAAFQGSLTPTTVAPSPVVNIPRNDPPLVIRAPVDCDVQNIDMQVVTYNPNLPMITVSVFCKGRDELYLNYRISKNISDEKLPRSVRVVKDETIIGRVEW